MTSHGGAQASPGAWKAEPAEEPDFANDPPELDAAFRSVTDQDPWSKAEALLEDGLTVQQVPTSAQIASTCDPQQILSKMFGWLCSWSYLL